MKNGKDDCIYDSDKDVIMKKPRLEKTRLETRGRDEKRGRDEEGKMFILCKRKDYMRRKTEERVCVCVRSCVYIV